MLAGLSSYTAAALGGAAVGLVVALVRRAPVIGAAAALVAAGAIAASGAAANDTHCRRRGGTRAVWSADLVTDARPRSIARATWSHAGCRAVLIIAVERGSAQAGSRVRIEGSATPGQRAIIVRDAQVAVESGARLLPRWRAGIGRRIDRLFGTDAPLVRALLIAEQGALPPTLRDQYSDAGLIHLLSVSGLHVAIVAGAVQLLLSVLRFRPAVASISGALLTALYVVLIGAPPAAVRSGGMLAALALGKVLQRPVSPWALLAIGALIPLRDPRVAGDLGYQLSVAGMAAVICAGSINRRFLAGRLAGIRRKLAAELTTAVLAAAITGPLVAAVFGRLSLISPFANLLAAPLIAVAQPALFLALALSPLEGAARLVADGARVPLALLERVAVTASSVPYAAVAVAPRSAVVVCLLLAGAACIVACAGTRPWRALTMATAAVAAAIWWPQRGSGLTELHMLDVGQGDAIAVRTARGRWLVVDAGRAWEGGDAGRSTVVPYIRRRGGDVAAFVLSHPHMDHAGGAATVLRTLRPRVFLDPSFEGDASAYRASLSAASDANVAWRRAVAGDRLVIDELTIDVLAPDSAWLDEVSDPNDASVILGVTVGSVRFLLTGDAEAGAERRLLDRGADVRADILKAGHHGSATSSSPDLLDAVKPRLALMSVGALNRYGHPGPEVVHALMRRRAIVLRTDVHGAIVVRTNGRVITVETEDETWDLPPARWK